MSLLTLNEHCSHMILVFSNYSWQWLVTDLWLLQVRCAWNNYTPFVLCKRPFYLGPGNKHWPWQKVTVMLERVVIALVRLPLKIPYIQTGYILSSLLLPTMSMHQNKFLKALFFIYLQYGFILHFNDSFLNLVRWGICRTLFNWAQDMELFGMKLFSGLLYTYKRQDFGSGGQRKENALEFSKELADILPDRNLFLLSKTEWRY